jgi:hypothetical protein
LGCVAAFLGGCMAPAATDLDVKGTIDSTGPVLSSAAAPGVDALAGLYWSGSPTKNSPLAFTVQIPDKYWDSHDGSLKVAIAWDHEQNTIGDYGLKVTDAQGRLVADGGTGWYASVALIDHAASGTYTATVTGGKNSKSFEGVVQVQATPKYKPDGHDLLPNLVTIPPSQLQISQPTFGPGNPERGCGYEETVEARAMRCLRVSNGVGNIGGGPLEVRLALSEAAKAPAGMGVWMQRIHRDDGSVHEVAVGPATFHQTHGHWHYSGLARFELFKYDLDAHKRLDSVGKGRKNGFCFFDIGLVKLGLPSVAPLHFDGNACLEPDRDEKAWYMGLSPGWYDFYVWGLPDQYVEITGLADGVYELVSTANGSDTLLETDKTDNAASAVIRLTGDKVELLSAWTNAKV